MARRSDLPSCSLAFSLCRFFMTHLSRETPHMVTVLRKSVSFDRDLRTSTRKHGSVVVDCFLLVAVTRYHALFPLIHDEAPVTLRRSASPVQSKSVKAQTDFFSGSLRSFLTKLRQCHRHDARATSEVPRESPSHGFSCLFRPQVVDSARISHLRPTIVVRSPAVVAASDQHQTDPLRRVHIVPTSSHRRGSEWLVSNLAALNIVSSCSCQRFGALCNHEGFFLLWLPHDRHNEAAQRHVLPLGWRCRVHNVSSLCCSRLGGEWPSNRQHPPYLCRVRVAFAKSALFFASSSKPCGMHRAFVVTFSTSLPPTGH